MSGDGSGLGFLIEELAALERQGLLRRPSESSASDRGIVMCSNDYLGFGSEQLPQAAVQHAGGSGASALVSGHLQEHRTAERALNAWLGCQASLLFSSGYAANLSVIAALVGQGDLVLSDRLNHASIVDGCRLSRATVRVFAHGDAAELEAALRAERRSFRRCLVVTESYFSMDGDGLDLGRYQQLASQHQAMLLVDEAHAIGIYGLQGRGRCSEAGFFPSVMVGTLGKSLGLQGAFVAGSARLREFLWNRARAFVFSTAISPALAAVIPDRVTAVSGADDRRARCHALADRIRSTLVARGADVRGVGPVIPWVLGSVDVALDTQLALAERGVIVSAIRPPTVPADTARLRITANAGLSATEELGVLSALDEVATQRQLARTG